MKEETALAVVFTVFIVTFGGCWVMDTHDKELTKQEREKTKQMEIQMSRDSMLLSHSNQTITKNKY